jgi:hypothetical protein
MVVILALKSGSGFEPKIFVCTFFVDVTTDP